MVYDALRLKQELDVFPSEAWLPHFNSNFFTGDWSVLPLRSIGAEIHRSFHNPAEETIFLDTLHLEKVPYAKSIIDSFKCEKTAVRYMKLGVNSSIKEHKDYRLSLEDEDVRIHIPVQTHSEMEFWLDSERIPLRDGECWYMNFNLNHKLFNPGPIPRVHLVIDLVINDWLRSEFKKWSPALSGVSPS